MVPQVFIIVPAYNESSEMLSLVLNDLLSTPFNIILVDDGSAEPVRNPQQERIVMVRHAVNLGQGASLQTGVIYLFQNQMCSFAKLLTPIFSLGDQS